MAWSAIRTALLAASLSVLLAGGAQADDNLKIAIGQRGGWEQSVSELGQNKGLFKKHGLTLELLYTQGSAETLQSVISNSVDIGIGLGTHAFLGAFLKGAPLRGVGASFTSADEQYYYVAADSPIQSIKEADGKSIAISTNGSASNMFALHLARHFGVNLKTATGRQLHRDLDAGADQAARHRLLGGAVQSQLRRRGQNPRHRPRQRRAGAARHDEPAPGRQRAGSGAKERRAPALHGGLSRDARLDVCRSRRDRRLCGMVEAAEGDRRARRRNT